MKELSKTDTCPGTPFLKEQATLLEEKGRVSQVEPRDSPFAWLITFASFINHCILFGVHFSFGVLYVALLDYYDTARGQTAWIGSISHGLLCFISPISGFFTHKYGCRVTTILGALLTSGGFIVSSFVTSMEYLYITYGLLVGSGLGLLYLPSRVITFHYIHKRRALATGLSSTGVGIGTIMFSTFYQVGLDQYGLRGVFLITGAIVLNAAVCGAIFRPVSQESRSKHIERHDRNTTKLHFYEKVRTYLEFARNRRYWLFVAADVISILAAFVPFAHLPRLSRDLNLTELQVSCLVPMMSVTNIIGRLIFGWIGDFKKVNVILLWSWSTVVCGICLLVCPFLKTFPLLVAFALIFGIFIGVWGGLKAMVLVLVVGTENLSKALSICLFLEGFAAIAGSPLAGWLYDITGNYSASFFNAGALLIFSGGLVIGSWMMNFRCSAANAEIGK